MTDLPAKLPCRREDALEVLRTLRRAGHVAYFAGGCVRDVLLGQTPRDWDVATDATPSEVRRLFPRAQLVGAAFGVVLVNHNASILEVATFRTEGAYTDGRRPDAVSFTDAQHDAHRRDFTINALFLDPETDRVIDYVGGEADLRARMLRAVGEPARRFAEDHLRLLRAVRFAARFDLALDPATADAIEAHAPLLPRISPERIADELRGMLAPPSRRLAWPMLWRLRLVQQVFRGIEWLPAQKLDEAACPLLRLPDEPVPAAVAITHAVLSYHRQNGHAWPDLLANTAARADAVALRRLLRLSNEEIAAFEQSVILAGRIPADTALAARKRFMAHEHRDAALLLMRSLAAVGHEPDAIAHLLADVDRLRSIEYAPAPLITGDDLVAAGLRPGPVFKRVLDEVYDAQLETRIATRDDALALAMRLAGASG